MAPATVANVSCGFDIFGFAVDNPGDEVTVLLRNEPGIEITDIIGDNGRLPRDAERNTAGVAVRKFLEFTNNDMGVSIVLKKNLPLGSGMGSSAASAAAALLAINHLTGDRLTRRELLPFAMEAERVACGSAHADNAAPSLLGGFVLIRDYDPLDVVDIPVPEDLFCTLVHPHIELKTEQSRRILRTAIPLKDAIKQWGNIAGLVAGLLKTDYALISRSIQDVVAEPARSLLIPGFDLIKAKARDAGALGSGISGSGPTVFALSAQHEVAVNSGYAIREVFKELRLESDVYVSRINCGGARIISSSK